MSGRRCPSVREGVSGRARRARGAMEAEGAAGSCAASRLDVSGQLAPFNLAFEVCGRWAAERQRFALYCEGEEGRTSAHTFWDVQRQANRLSNVLAALGTLPGDRVAIVLPQCAEAAAALVAVLQMAAVAVMLSPSVAHTGVERGLRDSAAHVAIVGQATRRQGRSLRERCTALRHVLVVGDDCPPGLLAWSDVLEHAAPRYTPARTVATDPAIILYDGGSAADRPPNLLAHRALLDHLDSHVRGHRSFPQPGDLVWSSDDWASASGLLDAWLPTWYFGVPVLAHDGLFSPEKAFALLDKYGIRNVLVSAGALQAMRETIPLPKEHYDLDLRTLRCTGTPPTDALLAWAVERLGVSVTPPPGTESDRIC